MVKDRAAVEKVIDHIKSAGDWLRLTTPMISELTGINICTSYSILQELKANDSLEHMTEEGSNANKRVTKFRFKGAVEIKAPQPAVMHPVYKNLTVNQVDVICLKMQSKGTLDATVQENLLKIMNILAASGAIENRVKHYVDNISDLMIMKREKVRSFIQILEELKLAERVGNEISLTLKPENKQEEKKAEKVSESPAQKPEKAVKNRTKKTENVEKPTKTTGKKMGRPKKAINVPVIETVPAIEETKQAEVAAATVDTTEPKTDTTVAKNELITDLISSMNSMSGIIGDFQAHMVNAIQEISSLETNSKEVEEFRTLLSDQDKEMSELKRQLSEGNTALTRALNENSTLRENIRSLQAQTKRANDSYNAMREVNDHLFETMQERLQVAIADITATITNFANTNPYDIKNEGKRAILVNTVVKAITTAVDQIVASNNNTRPSIEER